MHLVLMLDVGPCCHQQPKAVVMAALTCKHGSGLSILHAETHGYTHTHNQPANLEIYFCCVAMRNRARAGVKDKGGGGGGGGGGE